MQGIAGRVALITGGASGIGAGLVEAFARAGAKVIFADIQAEAGAAVAQAIKGTVFQPADLREDRDIDHLVGKAQSAFGGIDFLINAAATYADKGFESDRAMWLNGFDTNLIGHVMLAKRARVWAPMLRTMIFPAIKAWSLGTLPTKVWRSIRTTAPV